MDNNDLNTSEFKEIETSKGSNTNLRLLSVLVFVAVVIGLTLYGTGAISFGKKDSIVFKTDRIEINTGAYKEVEFKNIPDNINKEELKWESSNPKVVLINDGVISAVSSGEATITVEYNGKKSSFKVVVKEPNSSVEPVISELVVEKKEINLKKGSSLYVVAKNDPDNPDNKIIWKSENTNIAKVSEDGLITGISVGTTTINVKNTSGKSVSIKVVVTEEEKSKVKELSIINGKREIYIGDKLKLSIDYKPTNAILGKIEWSSTDSNVLEVNENGEVNGLTSGTADIVVKDENGVSNKITITVKEKPVPFVIIFNNNGGSSWTKETCGNTLSGSVCKKTVSTGDKYGKLPVPTRIGYNFVGWYTGTTGGTMITESSVVSVTNEQELYAHWQEKKYEVIFDLNGGYSWTSATCANNLVGSKCFKNVVNGTKYGTLPTPTFSGYKFEGWYTSKTGGTIVTNTSTVSLSENQTLYAHWSIVTYTITFNLNNGSSWTNATCKNNLSGSTCSKIVNADGNYGILPSPERSGYTFVGWYTQASGGTEITSSSIVKISQNQTLYAHWSTKTYVITFNVNGGDSWTSTTCGNVLSGSNCTKNVGAGDTYGNLPTPTRKGYSLNGWYTQASGGTKITSSTKVSITENQTLYAHWEKENITVQVEDVRFSSTSSTVEVGYEADFKVSVLPDAATDKSINWSSDKESVATVSSNGHVKAVGVGVAKIKAESKSNPAKYAIYTLTVNAKTIAVSSVTIKGGNKTVKVGDSSFTFQAEVLPSDATNKTIEWTSSNTSVATIDKNTGKVTIKAAGSTTITAKAVSNGKSGTVTLTVNSNTSTGVQIRVGTFNLGRFTCGPSFKCTPTVEQMASFLKSKNLDIIGIQEGYNLNTYDYYSFQKVLNNIGNYRVTSYSCANRPNCTGQLNAIGAKSSISYTDGGQLNLNTNCDEPFGEPNRTITKTVFTINGVNISMYASHFGNGSGENGCVKVHFKSAVDLIKNDPNPAIFVADYNRVPKDYIEEFFVPAGFEIAAHETGTHNMWNAESYCDSVLILPRNHIRAVKSETVDAYNSYSDHNMVVATLEIYK